MGLEKNLGQMAQNMLEITKRAKSMGKELILGAMATLMMGNGWRISYQA
jgi:hypothetical protein